MNRHLFRIRLLLMTSLDNCQVRVDDTYRLSIQLAIARSSQKISALPAIIKNIGPMCCCSYLFGFLTVVYTHSIHIDQWHTACIHHIRQWAWYEGTGKYGRKISSALLSMLLDSPHFILFILVGFIHGWTKCKCIEQKNTKWCTSCLLA